jgi:hypothetical protein
MQTLMSPLCCPCRRRAPGDGLWDGVLQVSIKGKIPLGNPSFGWFCLQIKSREEIV